jgi:hypothetical protein
MSSLIPLNRPLPILDMIPNNLRRLLRTVLPSNGLHKIPIRIHQVEIYRMIHQVILAGLDSLRRAEIYSVCFTDCFYLFPGPGQSYERGVEFRKVGFHDCWGIAGRIARYENGTQHPGVRFLDEVDHVGHFVEFFGADVWAVGEAEVDLDIIATVS